MNISIKEIGAKNYLYIPILIIFFDFITKIIAFNSLAYEKTIPLNTDISLYLTFNKTQFNSSIYSLGLANNNAIIFIALVALFYGVLFLLLPKILKIKIIRICIYIVLEVVFSFILVNFISTLKEVNIKPYTASIIKIIGPLFLFSVILLTTKDRGYKIIWSIPIGAGCGNLLSYFYYPYSVIDFIFSRKLNSILNLGIFNIADITVYIFVFSLIIYTPIFFIIAGISRIGTLRRKFFKLKQQ